jgi:hypothetical protein
MTALALYTYCYGMTAVLVRTHVLAGQLRCNYTWLVGMLLLGVGSSVPSVFAYLFFGEHMRSGADGGWWMLPNPGFVLYEFVPHYSTVAGNTDYKMMCFWFLGTWGALATVLCTRWYLAQATHFHPPEKKSRREVEYARVALVEPASSVGAT